MTPDLSTLPNLLAYLFIARPDVKAKQVSTGEYYTDVVDHRADPQVFRPWDAESIQAHLDGRSTYGHYLLGQDNQCKIMAFDIDFDKEGMLPTLPLPIYEEHVKAWQDSFTMQNPRDAWLDRAHPARAYMKQAMRSLAHCIQRAISDLDIPTAVAYTGAKGLHVYGFTGRIPASDVREGIDLVMENDLLMLEPARGKVFYKWGGNTFQEHKLFTVEVFPKQTEITKTGGFGNLMRLPLGRNQKSPDPTFFVDTNRPLGELVSADPFAVLSNVAKQLIEDNK